MNARQHTIIPGGGEFLQKKFSLQVECVLETEDNIMMMRESLLFDGVLENVFSLRRMCSLYRG